MMLIINICKEKLHYFEFVKPITDILDKEKMKYFVKDYNDLKESDLKKASKVIICGTSSNDNGFFEDINEFLWLKDFNKPVFGICGGMQIIGLIYGGKLKKSTEIGFYFENFKKDFLGMDGKQEVYHLHNNYVEFGKEFIKFAGSKIPQAIKHKDLDIYGVLFHPEVRQKHLITKFCLF